MPFLEPTNGLLIEAAVVQWVVGFEAFGVSVDGVEDLPETLDDVVKLGRVSNARERQMVAFGCSHVLTTKNLSVVRA